MTKLALEQAPPASLPRRFLLSMPCWGIVAGVLLIVDGSGALQTRWAPATLALVHVFTLGVLGNAMFGSVLQFLPVAVGAQLRGTARFGGWLHGVFNLGTLLLVVGFHQHWPLSLLAAGVLLPLAFIGLVGMSLPGLLAVVGQPLLQSGFVTALLSGLLTALLGASLLFGMLAGRPGGLPALTDVHASWGVLGWVLVLMASVARVVMPMFQGTGATPASAQAVWQGSMLLALLGAAWWRWSHNDASALVLVLALYAGLFALALLWRQWRAPRLRRGPLQQSWSAGLGVLLLASLLLLAGPSHGVLAAVLGVGIGLPLMVAGMAMEIVPFLGWIDLQRRIGRGVQLPGVQRLLPAQDKTRALLAQLPLLSLPLAVLWPSPWLARLAGLALVVAWLALGWALYGVGRRADRFVVSVEHRA
ncbi:MAG: hypothetical protein ACTS5I_00635 [Rhodanobacter sp.]